MKCLNGNRKTSLKMKFFFNIFKMTQKTAGTKLIPTTGRIKAGLTEKAILKKLPMIVSWGVLRIKNPTENLWDIVYYKRGLRDLNSRAGFPTYSLSRGAPSPLGYFSMVNANPLKNVAERVGFEPT